MAVATIRIEPLKRSRKIILSWGSAASSGQCDKIGQERNLLGQQSVQPDNQLSLQSSEPSNSLTLTFTNSPPPASLMSTELPAISKYEATDPDVRLMLQVRAGNAVAFEELVQRYQARLVGILEHLVPGKGQAEDLAQEVFMRVYRARLNYQPTAKFSTWLFTIANNVASNAIRKLVKRKEVHLQSSPSGMAQARPLDNMAQAASGMMPTRQLAQSEVSEIVKLAIQSLNERQRTAMLLSKYEHMSYEEIGDTMSLSTQAVKSLLSRARANLRDILQPYVQLGHRPPLPGNEEGGQPSSAPKNKGGDKS